MPVDRSALGAFLRSRRRPDARAGWDQGLPVPSSSSIGSSSDCRCRIWAAGAHLFDELLQFDEGPLLTGCRLLMISVNLGEKDLVRQGQLVKIVSDQRCVHPGPGKPSKRSPSLAYGDVMT